MSSLYGSPQTQQPAPRHVNLWRGADGRPRPGWRVAIFFFCYLTLTLIFQVALGVLYVFNGGSEAGLNGPILQLLAAALGLPAALVPAYLLWRLVDKRHFPEMGFVLDWGKIGGGAVLGLVQGAFCMGVVFALEYAFGLVSVKALVADPALILAFFALIAAAASEEIAFRGYSYQTAAGSWGTLRAGLLCCVLFGLAHGGNPNVSSLALLNIIFAGAVFLLQLLATGNLWLPIAFHFAWNFFEGCIFGFPVSGLFFPTATLQTTTGNADWFTGGAFGPEGGLSSTLVLAVITLFTLWQWRRARRAQQVAAAQA